MTRLHVRRVDAFVLVAVIGALGGVGCFSRDGGDGGAGGSSGKGGSGGDGGSAGASGFTGGIGGVSGGIGGRGAAGGIGGMAGVGVVGGGGGGAASGASGAGGSAGGSGECMSAGDCRLVPTNCCSCEPPTSDQARAVPIDSDDFGAECATVVCGGCLEPTQPVTVVADCVNTTCSVVKLNGSEFTNCSENTDCELRSVDCCGFCGQANLQNAYAVHKDSGYDACSRPTPCPAIACVDTEFLVEPFCDVDQHCAVRLVP